MRLVLIHGRAQEGKSSDELKEEWLVALRRGLLDNQLQLPADTDVQVPFYGNRLDELIRQLDAPLVEDAVIRGDAKDSIAPEFRGELLEELAKNAQLSDEEIKAEFTGEIQERGPANWEWVHAILKALDKKTDFGDNVIETFTRDVYVYLTNAVVRREIDGIVAAALPEQGPCVVVGHSLGSVVGYNVLRRAANSIQVKKYVTVGSPLGLKSIRKRVESPIKMPECVSEWFNAYDDGDIVALLPLDENHFNVDPPIVNKGDVNNHTDNQHSIAGYLDDPEVAKQIQTALT
ncbi:MAG: hypothetical protein AMXMBFR84_18710 [Candidatus Hydrogenedentota bacterium]